MSQFLGRKLASPAGAVEYRSRATGRRYKIVPTGGAFLLSIDGGVFRRRHQSRRQLVRDIEFLDKVR